MERALSRFVPVADRKLLRVQPKLLSISVAGVLSLWFPLSEHVAVFLEPPLVLDCSILEK